jgi:hypothetical protein
MCKALGSIPRTAKKKKKIRSVQQILQSTCSISGGSWAGKGGWDAGVTTDQWGRRY